MCAEYSGRALPCNEFNQNSLLYSHFFSHPLSAHRWLLFGIKSSALRTHTHVDAFCCALNMQNIAHSRRTLQPFHIYIYVGRIRSIRSIKLLLFCNLLCMRPSYGIEYSRHTSGIQIAACRPTDLFQPQMFSLSVCSVCVP